MQELLCKKFNLKVNFIPNGLEKYMSFSINNKLSFIDSSKFLKFLVKNLGKDDVEYLSHCEKFKEQLPSKEKFYSLLTGKEISDKEYKHVPERNNERLSELVPEM